MHSPHTQALFYYWLGLRQNRKAPMRKDIEPRQITRLLPNMFILEHVDEDHIIFRLAGTAFCERYGREFRAHNFLSLWRGSDKQQLGHLIQDVLSNATPAQINYRGETIDRKVSDSELLLLPMMNDDGEMNRILGCAYVTSNNDILDSQKIVNHWVTTYQFLNPSSLSMTPNAGAPRPARVDKPSLRIISSLP